MAARRMERAVALVLISAILAVDLPLETVAQSTCENVIESLSACYRYIYESDTTPSSQCCSRLENVVETQPDCLCQVLDGEGLNRNRVLALPDACNVRTPSASNCYFPPPSGYSTKILNSLQLSVLTAAASAGIFMII
ncbi:hypothetical protein Salat_0500500 [Sesamum alatum]|uniref:Bifunctional inhibitor/plant lipid transfer protein/seed storage helical domain-containing protein n=1 Tax=Sesamum alatum TaxID=300844 RepID=A0AAE1Z488_9LAMI|nr:hypothetical protein Salat_0500500 [Sesamum alatum]